MYIESLELKNYRNYQNLQLDFDKGTNIFYGDNAQGKTNILESVYLCGTTKSHRGSKDKEIIRFGEEESHIRMMIRKDELSYKIDMHLRKNKAKGVAINGLPIKKARELFGIVNLVFFSPEDLNIIKNGPGERRRFMDLELCQLDQIYLTDLAGYNHIVNQRNRLLKDLYMNPSLKETLDIWDMQMLQYGTKIINKRKDFVRDLNQVIQDIHHNLTGGIEHLEVVYEPSTEAEDFENVLKKNRERDIRMKMTSAGPHRDDLSFVVNGIDIRKYGSQGQQRTAALSLKLSEIKLIEEETGEKPVLLLDDVLSELDNQRQSFLINSLGENQMFITTADISGKVVEAMPAGKIFRIYAGEVEMEI